MRYPLETLGFVAGHTIVIYLYLVLMIRLFARRQMGQMSVVDLVIIILLGSSVETAMVNGDVSLPAGLVCASTLLVMSRLLHAALRHNRRLRHFILGGPVLIVHNGVFLDARLRLAGLTHADVLQAMREHESASLSDVRYAVLEPDGSLNIVRVNPPPTPAPTEYLA